MGWLKWVEELLDAGESIGNICAVEGCDIDQLTTEDDTSSWDD